MRSTRAAPKAIFPKMHVLFVDDDPIFCKLIEKTAEEMGLAVITCMSSSELEILAIPNTFDVAVVDYYLDGTLRDLRGSEVARSLGRTPVVLTSRDVRCRFDRDIWPSSIKRFVSKSMGARALLETALSLKPMR